MLASLLRDVRFGLKSLFARKTFGLAVLLTLAVCIGANVAIFSIVETVILSPLPYPEPDRLVTLYNSYPGAGAERGSNSAADYFFRRDRIDALEHVAALQGSGHTVGEAGETERVRTLRVTPSFFPLLGAEPVVGRTFTEEETEPGLHRKVVLTHGYWQERFGGSPDAVGSTLRVDGEAYAVVGVLAEDFRVVGRPDARFFVPIPFSEDQRSIRSWHSNNYDMLARLAPGATVERATSQIDALNASLVEEWPVPNAGQLLEDAGFETVVVKTGDDVLRDVEPVLFLLWIGVGFVLLIGCVNIANLMLARSHARLRELATRLALGARRARLARQILTESAVTGLLGGALGVAVGAGGLSLLRGFGIEDLPRGAEIGVDGPVLLFTVAVALGAALLFGSIPVAHVLRSELQSVFREEGPTGSSSRRSVLLRRGLVTGQIAVAFLLLAGSGLMFRSFRAAVSVDPGFEPAGVLTARLDLPESRYPEADDRRRFVSRLLEDVRGRAGVEGAAVTNVLPFSGNYSSSVVFPEGYEMRPGESLLSPYQTRVGPDYFRTMGIEVLRGRGFRESDGPDATNVMVIDEWLADRYWPDESPLGRRMAHNAVPGQDEIDEENYYTVVGVVETIRQNELTTTEHSGAYYFTYRQLPFGDVDVVARSGGSATGLTPLIRDAVGRLDPELPLYRVTTMEERVAASLASERTAVLLLLVFASVALLLAVVGIYGMLAYAVAQRRREIGIRKALGSGPDGVFRLVVREGLALTGAGLAIGGVVTLVAVRFIRSLLFGVEPTDPLVLGGVALLLTLVAVTACLVPAYRAARTDTVSALIGS